jgi:hypothetical protein
MNERWENSEQGICWMKKLHLVFWLLLAAPFAQAERIVKQFSGSENTTTAIFVVESPWLLDWRLDADYENFVALEISLVEAHGGRHVGRVLRTQRKGNGIKLFREGGMYQLRISTTLARWRIKIIQISDEEAELYTPRGQQ